MSSKLQKKCFVGSVVAHGLAVVALVVGSAFVTPKKNPEPMPALMDLFSVDQIKFTDDPVPPPLVPIAKGEPDAKVEKTQIEPEPVKQQDPPKVDPPKPEPKKEEPLKKEEPAKKVEPPKTKVTKAILPANKENKIDDSEERLRRATASMQPKKTEPPKLKHEIKLSFAKADDSKLKKDRELAAQKEKERRDKAAEDARREREYQAQVAAATAAAQKAQEDRVAKFRGIAEGLAQGLSSGTAIEMPGPNAFAFANYGQFVHKKFKDAWTPPNEANASATCRVEVKIARDGKVISARILNKSNDAVMDRTVQKALDRVKQLPPFPEGAKDAERTFLINFNINPTRQIG